MVFCVIKDGLRYEAFGDEIPSGIELIHEHISLDDVACELSPWTTAAN